MRTSQISETRRGAKVGLPLQHVAPPSGAAWRGEARRSPVLHLRSYPGQPRGRYPSTGEPRKPTVRSQVTSMRASYAYFLIFMLTPAAPNVNFTPCVVDTRRISTPFWFFMMLAEAPPPTVAPVPAAV